MNIALVDKPTKIKRHESKQVMDWQSLIPDISKTQQNFQAKIDRETGMIVEPMEGCCELVDWL